ncbi:MAG: DUF2064 domain-containing protein [Geodermatophilaceae bacterium]
MRARAAVLLLTGADASSAAPPGCDGHALAAAMAEDVLTVFAELDDVDEVIAFSEPRRVLAEAIGWPGTTLLCVPAEATPADVLSRLAGMGYREAALVASDAPDLPALHVAKAFSALGTSPAAVALAVNGGVVILASRLPPPAGLGGAALPAAPGHSTARRTHGGDFARNGLMGLVSLAAHQAPSPRQTAWTRSHGWKLGLAAVALFATWRRHSAARRIPAGRVSESWLAQQEVDDGKWKQ